MANSDWNINSDIYDIASNINDLQKRYIEDEDETTLSLGVFGFISDLEAKKIQTSVIMTGQLGNEMFPTRSMLTKNVLTHAAYNGISDINARPANITITLCTKVEDILKYGQDDGCFYLDHMSPIYIENIEFHFDYDIKITKKKYPYLLTIIQKVITLKQPLNTILTGGEQEKESLKRKIRKDFYKIKKELGLSNYMFDDLRFIKC